MAMIDMHVDSIPEEGNDSMSWCDWCEIALLRMLRYGLFSCHWSLRLPWWLGLVVCSNRWQARSVSIYYFKKFLYLASNRCRCGQLTGIPDQHFITSATARHL